MTIQRQARYGLWQKRIVLAIGHKDLGTNLPEQKAAVARTAKVIADLSRKAGR